MVCMVPDIISVIPQTFVAWCLPDMNIRVFTRSTGAVTVVVARPVSMEAPKWVAKLSPMPVVLIHHCFAWS